MKVLLKSLKELEEEYGIEKIDSYLIIGSSIIDNDMIKLLGKVVEAHYEKETDSYFVSYCHYDCYFDSNLIKGEVINEETIYTIKRLSDGIEYTLSL
jgi:hypothetical protein